MNIRDLKNLSLEEVIAKIHRNEIADAVIYTLPLDTALTNFQVSLMGNFIGCINATDANANVSIEFNKIGSGQINFTQGLEIARPFDNLFLTSTAQAGKTITFVISSYAPELFGIQDNRSNTLTASYLANIQAELQGGSTLTNAADVSVTTSAASVLAADSPHAVSFFADLANTDVIYIGNASVSATRKWIALRAGDFFSVDDYKGEVYAVSGSGTQKLSVASW